MSNHPRPGRFEDLPILAELRDQLEQHLRTDRRSRPALRWPRWGRRRSRLLIVFVVLALAGGSAYAAIALTHRSAPLSGAAPSLPFPWRHSLAGWRYDIELAPTAEAGKVGWCEGTFYLRDGKGPGGFGQSSCPGSPPTVDEPLFAQAGTTGPGIWDVLTAPNVAAVRIAGVGTILTRPDPRLPYGYRAAVIDLPRALPGAGPKLTALDAAGHAIAGPSTHETAEPAMPTRRWRAGEPVRGSCSIHARPGSGVQAREGTVVTRIIPAHGIVGHAFFTCINAQVSIRTATAFPLLAALMLDAAHPGRTLAPLPDMHAVPGQPGILERQSPFPRTRRHRRNRHPEPGPPGEVPDSPFQGLTARRIGNAWLVVEGGSSLAERIHALRALTAGPIETRAP